MKKKIVVLGFLGTNLDLGGKARWGTLASDDFFRSTGRPSCR